MRIPPIVSHVGLAVVFCAVGILIGRAQSDQLSIVHGEEVEVRLVAILKMPEPLVRARALSTFFSQLNASNVELVEEVYKQRLRDVDEVAKVLFAAWWARFDPAGAFNGRPDSHWGGNDAWVRAVIREWTRRDPAGALAAVEMIPAYPEARKLEANRSLIKGWFDHTETDPDELIVIFKQVGEIRPFGELIMIWVDRMVETRGVDYAIDYAESIPDDKSSMRVKRELMARLAGQVVTMDPDRAVAFAERNMDSEAGSKMAFYMVGRWARRDGPAAMEWALPLVSKTSHKVVERVWRSFHKSDPDAALAFMEQQPFSPSLEPAYTLYLLNVAHQDYRQALALSDQLQDPRRRLHVWQAIGRIWIVEDPAGAEAWMAEIKLPPDALELIRAHKRKAERSLPTG